VASRPGTTAALSARLRERPSAEQGTAFLLTGSSLGQRETKETDP
jgi:hypothetical protein